MKVVEKHKGAKTILCLDDGKKVREVSEALTDRELDELQCYFVHKNKVHMQCLEDYLDEDERV